MFLRGYLNCTQDHFKAKYQQKCNESWFFSTMSYHFTSVKTTIIKTSAAAAKSLQSCPTLCDPIDGSPPGSLVPGILQARTLEWVAISFSNAWKWKVKVNSLSRVQLLATTWTAAYQAPLFMGFSRQEYWSGVPLCSSKSTGLRGTSRINESSCYFIKFQVVETFRYYYW